MTHPNEVTRGLYEALKEVVAIVDSAGLLNLSRGVQLGSTAWYVKAYDRLKASRAAITAYEQSLQDKSNDFAE